MELDKTLNFKKVRCVKGYDDCLKIGKEYEVIDVSVEIKVKDDDGEFLYWESDHFEPVLADNGVNTQDIGTDILDTNADIKDTPKFQVGSGFYFGLNSKIYIVKKCTDNEIFANDPYDPIELLSLRKIHCCPATPENYERLQATFTDIDFEAPPKPLTGIGSPENPLQGAELTPESKAVEPQFKAGDKVYAPSVGSKIYTVKDVGDGWCYPIRIDCSYDEDHEFTKEGLITAEGLPVLFLATELNHALLSQLYPNIEFEQPPKPLTGSDLARAMLEKGWKYVPCYVHDGSDDEAINRKHYVSVKNETPRSGYNFSGTGANDWRYAVPIDPRTGEPLTQAVLDE